MNEHETHAAVAYEMRESDNEATCPWWADGGDCVHCPMGGAGKNCPFDKFADRLEAAHKREIEKLNSVIQATVSHSDAEIDRLRREAKELRKQIGDAAKLREALVGLIDGICFHCDLSEDCKGVPCEKMQKAQAALAAHARNCDRPECATTKAAQDVWRKEDGGKTAYYDWLLAPATGKEGGNNAD